MLDSVYIQEPNMPETTAFNSLSQSPQKKLKIAVLIRDFVPTGGAERYALEVSRRLATEHDVHVFAQTWAFEGKEEITFHRIPKFFTRPSFLNQLLFSYFTSRRVDQSFSVIHSHERVTRFDVLTIHAPCFRSLLTRQKSGWKRFLIWVSVGLSPRKLVYLWLEKRQFTYSEKRLLIAVSENVKRNVQSNYPLPGHCFRIAYPGVDADLALRGSDGNQRRLVRTRLGIGQDELVILFVGTEFKRKGLEALLRGFAMIPRSNARLVVAGGGGGKEREYMALAQALGIGKETMFLGLMENITDVYAMSDIYVLPTLSDPSPMAPVEAMACGLPTVVSSARYAGTAEHVKQGEALILKDPRDPGEIAEALRKLMDKEFREALGEKGRQLARSLTWEKTTRETLAAYYHVLACKEANP